MREKKFRLRLDDKIVGYEKWYSGERAPDENRPEERYWRANPCWLYSENGEYWNPSEIFHNRKDGYTGLKDKNGVEIYEGELIEYPVTSFPIEIIWDDFSCGFKLRDHLGQLLPMPSSETMAQYSLVIGNIHMNPELIGNKEGG